MASWLTAWLRPAWLRPAWLRPAWLRPAWLRPAWLRPAWRDALRVAVLVVVLAHAVASEWPLPERGATVHHWPADPAAAPVVLVVDELARLGRAGATVQVRGLRVTLPLAHGELVVQAPSAQWQRAQALVANGPVYFSGRLLHRGAPRLLLGRAEHVQLSADGTSIAMRQARWIFAGQALQAATLTVPVGSATGTNWHLPQGTAVQVTNAPLLSAAALAAILPENTD